MKLIRKLQGWKDLFSNRFFLKGHANNGAKQNRRGIPFINLYSEFVMATLVFLSLGLVVVSQIFVQSDASKTLSVNTIEAEGVDLDVYQQELTSGTLTLKVEGTEAFDQVAVLLNGDAYGNFSSDTLTFDIRGNTLVEIDGRNLEKPFSVSVIAASDNVVLPQEPVHADVEGNIQFLTRVFLRESSGEETPKTGD